MSRSRMMKDDEPHETPSPRTNIVGGQPEGDKGGGLPPVPTGIQRLLRLASIDAQFRRELIERRGEVAAAANVPLTDSEQAILAAIPAPLLADMATKMPPPPAPRRDFLRQTAATAVVLLGGAALSEAVAGCDKPSKSGDPDHPKRPDHNEMQGEGGAAPDEPPQPEADAAVHTPARPDHREMDTDGGAEPDMPPERPDEKKVTRGAAHDLPPERETDRPMNRKGGAEPDMPPGGKK